MNKKVLFLMILVGILLSVTGVAVSAEKSSANVPKEEINSASGGTLGSRISVAVSSTLSEEDPAVAFCDGIYMVVYAADDDIYGQRIDQDGNLLDDDPIKINDDLYWVKPTREPDVACIWPDPLLSTKYFVVVWRYEYSGSDYDIHAQALTTQGSIISGNELELAASGDNERNPTIACEVDDYYCMVLYRFDNTDIEGRRLELIEETFSTYLESFGDKFDPGTIIGSDEENPDVTWSKTQEEYMAVWQAWYEDPNGAHSRIRYNFLYEDEQGDGVSEAKSASDWLIPLGTYGTGWEHTQEHPEAAFNNLSGNYMVTYRAFYGGNANGVGVLHNGSTMVGSPFYLDGNSRFSYRTEVAFSGGQTGVVNADDEFLAVNIESGSSYDYLDGAYIKTGSVSDQDVSIEYVTGSVHINNPDITGNPFDGNYLVVWEAVNPGTPGQSDIFAQRMGNMDNQSAIFLPLVLR